MSFIYSARRPANVDLHSGAPEIKDIKKKTFCRTLHCELTFFALTLGQVFIVRVGRASLS